MHSKLSNRIKAEAISLGFFACGIARAEAVDDATATLVRQWIDNQRYAGMHYMRNYTDKRLDPRLLMPRLKSIVCVAMNYTPAHHIPADQLQFAAYAYGADYHDIVKSKLRELALRLGFEELPAHPPADSRTDRPHFRVFCDSAPILERYWAAKAGLGWIGRNHQLIVPRAGSMFFLGELFLDIELDPDTPMPSRCGHCHACIDACPTHAIATDAPLDANKCLSYQTIENKGIIPTDIARQMGHTIYGCDRCQQACPWNRFAPPNHTPELQPKQELLEMTREKWLQLTEDDYRRIFKGSAVKRAKYTGLMRNIRTAASLSEQKKDDEDFKNTLPDTPGET